MGGDRQGTSLLDSAASLPGLRVVPSAAVRCCVALAETVRCPMLSQAPLEWFLSCNLVISQLINAIKGRFRPGSVQVLEDTGGVVRAENDRSCQALVAKQQADAAAREAQRAAAAATAQQAYLPGRGGLPPNGACSPAYNAAATNHQPVQFLAPSGSVPMTSFSAMMNAALAGQPRAPLPQPPNPQLWQQWPGVQPAGAPLQPAAAAGAWQQGLAGHQAALHASRAAPVPWTGSPVASAQAARAHQANGDPKRKRRSTAAAVEDKSAARSSSEGYRERWLAKKPRPNPNSWLSSVCSACEQPGTGEAAFALRFSIAGGSPIS